LARLSRVLAWRRRIQTFAIEAALSSRVQADSRCAITTRASLISLIRSCRNGQDLGLDRGMLRHEHQRRWPRPLNVELDPPELLDRQGNGGPPLGRHDHPSIGDQDPCIAGPGPSLKDLIGPQEVADFRISRFSHRTLHSLPLAFRFRELRPRF
jgi:hypothetical protein